MSKRTVGAALAGVLLAAGPAYAQTRGHGEHGAEWSVLGAETVAPGSDVVHGAFGWPDVTFNYTHGVAPDFDVGGRMQLLYGVENTTSSQFGMAFAVPLRFTLARQHNLGLLFHWDPGLRFYTTDPVLFGFQFPFGVNLEIHAANVPVKFGLGVDFNASLFVTGFASPRFFFGPLFGPFFEFHVDPQLAVGLDTRFGPVIDAFSGENGFSGGTHTEFGFRTQLVLAYRVQ